MSRFKGIVYLTQAQYEALTTKDADVLYCVSDKNVPIPTTSDSGKIVKVGSTGNYELGEAPASSVGFADITGQPSDNTNLSTALSGKLDKVSITGNKLVYGVGTYGQQTNYIVSAQLNANAIVQRAGQNINVATTPELGNHATSKTYVDTADALKQNITDNTLSTTAKTVVGAINENKSDIDNVRAVAEGKNKAYVISIDDNPDFDSEDASITKTSFVTIDSETVLTSALKKGDVVYVVETDVPDRWYAGSNAFKVLETTKVDLTSYQTKQDNSLATTSKEVVGAINELHQENIDERDDIVYLTNSLANKQQLIQVHQTYVTVNSSGGHVNVTAPTVTGYTFMCWLGCRTDGQVGIAYPKYWDYAKTTVFYNGIGGTISTITLYALYGKN